MLASRLCALYTPSAQRRHRATSCQYWVHVRETYRSLVGAHHANPGSLAWRAWNTVKQLRHRTRSGHQERCSDLA
ncbi:hypothetical protein PsYK624_162420 [Phanerochaete sordida]|uniref:Uncharacterized protein n=1 Tax=Phanerochaete sordida TaxID=48140 RepID=A0A9P3GRR2_9APHY|nr:hypothetical protein PsYK624_162420 [Phanerochaete sordida]